MLQADMLNTLEIYFIIQTDLIYSWKINWNLYYFRIFELLEISYYSPFVYESESEANPIKLPQLRVQVLTLNHKAKGIWKHKSLFDTV